MVNPASPIADGALSCMGPRWPGGLVENWWGFSRVGSALDTWVPVVLCQLYFLTVFWPSLPFTQLRHAHDILHFCWLQCKSGLWVSAVKDYVKVKIRFRCYVLYYFKKSLNYFDIAWDIPAARNAEDLPVTFFKSSQSPEKTFLCSTRFGYDLFEELYLCTVWVPKLLGFYDIFFCPWNYNFEQPSSVDW